MGALSLLNLQLPPPLKGGHSSPQLAEEVSGWPGLPPETLGGLDSAHDSFPQHSPPNWGLVVARDPETEPERSSHLSLPPLRQKPPSPPCEPGTPCHTPSWCSWAQAGVHKEADQAGRTVPLSTTSSHSPGAPWTHRAHHGGGLRLTSAFQGQTPPVWYKRARGHRAPGSELWLECVP